MSKAQFELMIMRVGNGVSVPGISLIRKSVAGVLLIMWMGDLALSSDIDWKRNGSVRSFAPFITTY